MVDPTNENLVKNPQGTFPPCGICRNKDRMKYLGQTGTDFEATVVAWACQKCGMVAILIMHKPETGGPNQ